MRAWALIAAGFAFWIAESWWFGWNMMPQSGAERVCDLIAAGLVWAGFFTMLGGLSARVAELERRASMVKVMACPPGPARFFWCHGCGARTWEGTARGRHLYCPDCAAAGNKGAEE